MFRHVVLIFSLMFNSWAHAQDPKCLQALLASGPDWSNTHFSPKADIHPGFSKVAAKIYFYYDIPGLEIFLEQGPYGGWSIGSNKINAFYLDYDPRYFPPLSFHRLIFGNKPLKVLLNKVDFSRYYDESMLGENEILQIRIPITEGAEPWDLSKAIQLIISRDTGQVYGYGPKSGNCVSSFLKDCWLELRANRNAEKHGYGVWYNSNSGMSTPDFFERALKEREETSSNRQPNFLIQE